MHIFPDCIANHCFKLGCRKYFQGSFDVWYLLVDRRGLRLINKFHLTARFHYFVSNAQSQRNTLNTNDFLLSRQILLALHLILQTRCNNLIEDFFAELDFTNIYTFFSQCGQPIIPTHSKHNSESFSSEKNIALMLYAFSRVLKARKV